MQRLAFLYDSRVDGGHYETGNPLGTESRYAIRPSRPPAFTAGTERTYGPGHAAHEGGKACEDLSSDRGEGSDHRHPPGPPDQRGRFYPVKE